MRAQETFGARIRRLIEERRLTQAEAARRANLDRSELNRLANGKRDPRPHEVGALAAALDVEQRDLIEGLSIASMETFAEECDRAYEFARRVLLAEQEATAAKASLKALEDTFHEHEATWRKERAALQESILDERRAGAERLRQAEEKQIVLERQHMQALAGMQDRIGQLSLELRRCQALRAAAATEATALQTELAQARSRVAATGTFAGLAGVALGALLGAAGGNRDEDD